MTRVKRGTVRIKKRRRLLEHAKGFMWRRKNVYKIAKEAVRHSMADMFIGRKRRKRDMRRLWIIQINAAARAKGLSYSELMHALKKEGVSINRKTLSELARTDDKAFAELTEKVKTK